MTSPSAHKRRYQTRCVSTVDGEGIEWNGRHVYTLLVWYNQLTSETVKLQATKRQGYRLSTSDCLNFLLDASAQQRSHICAGYSINYDVTKWLEDLTPDQLTALHRSGYTVYYDGTHYFYIEYVPSHTFFVGELPAGAIIENKLDSQTSFNWQRSYPGMRSVRIDDVWPFAQSSFVHMLKEWNLCDEDILAFIAAEKESRGAFEPSQLKTMLTYCTMECIYLSDYIRALQCACLAEGLKLPGWYGPGAIARALMDRYQAKKRLANPPEPWIGEAAIAAYYGGRIEHHVVGRVSHVYNYDIQSAYPAALAEIPNLAGGVWRSSAEYMPGVLGLWHVKWSLPADDHRLLMPFPWRQNGRVWYPARGEGWYHACLVDSVVSRYPDAVRVMDGYYYDRDDLDNVNGPFGFVPEIAARRLAYKAAGDPRHRILKLGLNSLYGKMAQHQTGEKAPRYQCYLAAGYATARTQARLFDAVYAGGRDASDVVALATDGFYTTQPRDIVGTGLGSWELAGEYDNLYSIQPGVVVGPDGPNGAPRLKRTRGFGAKHLDYARVHEAWQTAGPMASYAYTERRFVGIGACTGHNRYDDYGQWVDQERIISYWPGERDIDWSGNGESYRLWPLVGDGSISHPYYPPSPNDLSYAQDVIDELRAMWVVRDQPA